MKGQYIRVSGVMSSCAALNGRGVRDGLRDRMSQDLATSENVNYRFGPSGRSFDMS